MRPDRAPSPFSGRSAAGRADAMTSTDPNSGSAALPLARPEPAFARTLDADPLAVRGVLQAAVARFGRSIGQDEAGILELALAEVLNNVVEHGYNGQPAGLIRVVIGRSASFLNCRVEDAGSPVPDEILTMTLTDEDPFPEGEPIPEGGFGWKMIHSLVTDLRYVQIDGYNRLNFRIPLGTAVAAVPQSCLNTSPSKPESGGTTAA
jgi:serine/threonine-protein kinase RsbW